MVTKVVKPETTSEVGHHVDGASPRERLLAAADELFYEEGVRSVGIDRIIERAGVAKATLYSAFGSKDGLIRAYLHERHAARRQRITTKLARFDDPRDKLLAVYDVLDDLFRSPTFRGCAFLNASAEAQPGSAIAEASDEYRVWFRDLITDLATQAGAIDPVQLTEQLTLLYDGATVGAKMDHNPGVAAAARSVAATLIDASIAR